MSYLVCIGGPYDGRRIEVVEDLKHGDTVEVPPPLESSEPILSSEEAVSLQHIGLPYRVTVLMTSNKNQRITHKMLVWAQLTCDPYGLLIDGYRRFRPIARTCAPDAAISGGLPTYLPTV